MSEIIKFAVIGLASGALYVLISLGMVIIHRVSRIVNYAQGAIGMVGTYVFWDLNQRHHVNYAVAVIAGLLVCALIGVLTHVLVMRPLRTAAPVTRMIATLGILTVLEQAAARYYPANTITVPSQLPTSTLRILGATVGWNQIIIIGIALVVAAGLTLLYRGTQFGRLTAATSENQRALAALGKSADRIAAANWAIGGALAGAAGILLAPITGLDVTQFTLLVLPALAAAVVGRLSSFGLTVVGGLVIGIAQAEMSRYVSNPGWSAAAPFILIVVVLVLRGRDKNLRSNAGERLPRLGSGRIRLSTLIPVVVIAVVVIQFLSPNWADAVTTTMTMAIILLSLVVVTGYSGQLSLAQFAFAGWGAWVAGRIAAAAGLPFLVALVIGVAVTLPLGLLVGFVCLRTRGINLSIATLAFAVGLEQIVFDHPAYTGGVNGIVVDLPEIFGLDVDSVIYPGRYAVVCVVFFLLVGLAVASLRRGRTGRRMIAVRGNERAAASLGINAVGARLYGFCLASVIAALGGILLAFRDPAIVYTSFDSLTSIQLVSQAVVGGVGWIAGPVIGGLLTVGSIGTQILNLLGAGVAVYLPLIGGVLLLVTVVQAPDGLAYLNWRQLHALAQRLNLRGRRKPAQPVLPELARLGDNERHTVRPATLEVQGLTVRYGGVTALNEVSLRVEPGQVVGLIGPNGAGKTTLVDAVTGFTRLSGTVLLDGRDITGWSPARLSRAGIARSFQSLELFDDMTVLDNLRVAAEPRGWASYVLDLFWARTPPLSAAALTTIREFDLVGELGHRPSDLPYGRRRQVGIGRAVATAPSILMLDEPAAGLDDRETRELGSLIRGLARNWGMGVLLIEHDVDLVMSTCDRVYALDFGSRVAEGTPAEIRRSPAVIASYLGEPASEVDSREVVAD
ncbi:MAG TPA: branched-chain amino acid ABC transporter permease/ATP-binding protein [Amycolatopsis sp.]|nr:branched-chain amino acid ABC transporter permease/ATP-binding protein [Amycolatopsis sp.]